MFLIHKLLNMTYIYFPEISRMEDTIEKLRPYFNYISKSAGIGLEELAKSEKKTENSVGTKKGKKVKKVEKKPPKVVPFFEGGLKNPYFQALLNPIDEGQSMQLKSSPVTVTVGGGDQFVSSVEVTANACHEVTGNASVELTDKPTVELADKSSVELAHRPGVELADKHSVEMADEHSVEMADKHSVEMADEPSDELTDFGNVESTTCSIEVNDFASVEVTRMDTLGDSLQLNKRELNDGGGESESEANKEGNVRSAESKKGNEKSDVKKGYSLKGKSSVRGANVKIKQGKCRSMEGKGDSVQENGVSEEGKVDEKEETKKDKGMYEYLGKERIESVPAKRKGWKPPFNPSKKLVCWKLGCNLCNTNNCKVCKKCKSKKRCVLRDCPRLKTKDFIPSVLTSMTQPKVSVVEDASFQDLSLEDGNQDLMENVGKNVTQKKNICRSGSASKDTIVDDSIEMPGIENSSESTLGGVSTDDTATEDTSNRTDNAGVKNESLFKCDMCSREFNYIKRFNEHVCGRKYQKIPCPSCSMLISSSNYARHIKLHSAVRFKCDTCGIQFSTQEKREVHMKLHVEHKCTFCGKIFRRPSLLKKHLLVHEEHQPESEAKESSVTKPTVKCKICNTEVSSVRVLGIHMHSFHKEVAFKCEVCSKAFFTKRGLKDHMKNHRRIEPEEEHTEINTENEVQENCSNSDGDLNMNQTDMGSSGFNNYVILDNFGSEVLENVIFVETAENSNTEGVVQDSDVQYVNLETVQLNY